MGVKRSHAVDISFIGKDTLALVVFCENIAAVKDIIHKYPQLVEIPDYDPLNEEDVDLTKEVDPNEITLTPVEKFTSRVRRSLENATRRGTKRLILYFQSQIQASQEDPKALRSILKPMLYRNSCYLDAKAQAEVSGSHGQKWPENLSC